MNHRRWLTLCILFVLTVGLIGGVLYPRSATAQTPLFVGTYFTSGQSGDNPTNLIITISTDGNINIDFGVGLTNLSGNAFTPAKGVWRQTGPNAIEARVVSFSFFYPSAENPDGVVIGNGISNYTITIDGNSINGSYNGATYAADVDLLDPGDVQPLFSYSGTFMGERITLVDDSDTN